MILVPRPSAHLSCTCTVTCCFHFGTGLTSSCSSQQLCSICWPGRQPPDEAGKIFLLSPWLKHCLSTEQHIYRSRNLYKCKHLLLNLYIIKIHSKLKKKKGKRKLSIWSLWFECVPKSSWVQSWSLLEQCWEGVLSGGWLCLTSFVTSLLHLVALFYVGCREKILPRCQSLILYSLYVIQCMVFGYSNGKRAETT